MSTTRETILQAVVDLLDNVPDLLGGAHRSRADALAREESPAVVVRWTGDNPREVVHLHVDSDLSIELDVYRRGDVPDQLADPVAEHVHAALMADPTLGGLLIDLAANETLLELDGADDTAAWITMRFTAWYRRSRQVLGPVTPFPDLQMWDDSQIWRAPRRWVEPTTVSSWGDGAYWLDDYSWADDGRWESTTLTTWADPLPWVDPNFWHEPATA